jgi:hypothetical protein
VNSVQWWFCYYVVSNRCSYVSVTHYMWCSIALWNLALQCSSGLLNWSFETGLEAEIYMVNCACKKVHNNNFGINY